MMDKKQVAHEIALSLTKTYCGSIPLESDIGSSASNMAKKYLEAYVSAKTVLDESDSNPEHMRVLK